MRGPYGPYCSDCGYSKALRIKSSLVALNIRFDQVQEALNAARKGSSLTFNYMIACIRPNIEFNLLAMKLSDVHKYVTWDRSTGEYEEDYYCDKCYSNIPSSIRKGFIKMTKGDKTNGML